MSFDLVEGKAPSKPACMQRHIVSTNRYSIIVRTVRYGLIEVNEICLSWICFITNVDSHKLTLVPEMQICSVKKATTLQEKFGLQVEYPIQWGVLL